MLRTKFQVDSQTSVHFPPKNGSEFFAFADAPPVRAVAIAFMCEIFSGVCYLKRRKMKSIQIQTIKKESIL